MEGAPSRDWFRPSVPRAVQVVPCGNRRLLLSSRSVRRAERVAREPGGACGTLALVKFGCYGPRDAPGRPDSGLAAASACGLAGIGKPLRDRGGTSCDSPLRESWLSIRQCRLGSGDRTAIRTGVHVAAQRASETQWMKGREDLLFSAGCPVLVAVTFASQCGHQ